MNQNTPKNTNFAQIMPIYGVSAVFDEHLVCLYLSVFPPIPKSDPLGISGEMVGYFGLDWDARLSIFWIG